MRQHPTILGPSVRLGKDTTIKDFVNTKETIRYVRNARAWRQPCWKSPVQTEQTLLRYTSAIAEQKKCWELLAQNFDQFQILGNNSSVSALNNMQQGVRTDATCKIQQCCVCLDRAAAILHTANKF